MCGRIQCQPVTQSPAQETELSAHRAEQGERVPTTRLPACLPTSSSPSTRPESCSDTGSAGRKPRRHLENEHGNGLPFKGSWELSGCSEAPGTNIPTTRGRPGHEADVSDSETGPWKMGVRASRRLVPSPVLPEAGDAGRAGPQQPKDLVSLPGFPGVLPPAGARQCPEDGCLGWGARGPLHTGASPQASVAPWPPASAPFGDMQGWAGPCRRPLWGVSAGTR